MNIYLFELKGTLKSCFWWIFSIIVVLIIFMIAVYPMFQEGSKELIDLFNNFPPEFLKAFGFNNVENLFGIEPFYAFCFTYIGLMSAIMSVFVSVEVFSREKRSKCMDFILTKPIGRFEIYLNKLYACLTVIVLSNIIYAVCTLVIFYSKIDGYKFTVETIQLVLAPFFTQLVFMSFGVFISVMFRKIRSVSALSTSIGIVAFMLSAVINMLEKEYLNYLAPLKYFNPESIIHNGMYDLKLVVFAMILIIAAIFISAKKYCCEDVAAV